MECAMNALAYAGLFFLPTEREHEDMIGYGLGHALAKCGYNRRVRIITILHIDLTLVTGLGQPNEALITTLRIALHDDYLTTCALAS
jgi:hypothetical protein